MEAFAARIVWKTLVTRLKMMTDSKTSAHAVMENTMLAPFLAPVDSVQGWIANTPIIETEMKTLHQNWLGSVCGLVLKPR
jgi:hypothetical protein